MSDDRKIYMKIDEEQVNQETLQKKMKDEIKEQPIEAALESVLKDISIKSVNGMMNISIPEPAWQLISALLTKLLFNEKEQEMEMRR